MIHAVSSFWAFWFPQINVSFDPPPEPATGPVFIHDAVSPWRGETLLCAMLRRDLNMAMNDADSDMR